MLDEGSKEATQKRKINTYYSIISSDLSFGKYRSTTTAMENKGTSSAVFQHQCPSKIGSGKFTLYVLKGGEGVFF